MKKYYFNNESKMSSLSINDEPSDLFFFPNHQTHQKSIESLPGEILTLIFLQVDSNTLRSLYRTNYFFHRTVKLNPKLYGKIFISQAVKVFFRKTNHRVFSKIEAFIATQAFDTQQAFDIAISSQDSRKRVDAFFYLIKKAVQNNPTEAGQLLALMAELCDKDSSHQSVISTDLDLARKLIELMDQNDIAKARFESKILEKEVLLGNVEQVLQSLSENNQLFTENIYLEIIKTYINSGNTERALELSIHLKRATNFFIVLSELIMKVELDEITKLTQQFFTEERIRKIHNENENIDAWLIDISIELASKDSRRASCLLEAITEPTCFDEARFNLCQMIAPKNLKEAENVFNLRTFTSQKWHYCCLKELIQAEALIRPQEALRKATQAIKNSIILKEAFTSSFFVPSLMIELIASLDAHEALIISDSLLSLIDHSITPAALEDLTRIIKVTFPINQEQAYVILQRATSAVDLHENIPQKCEMYVKLYGEMAKFWPNTSQLVTRVISSFQSILDTNPGDSLIQMCSESMGIICFELIKFDSDNAIQLAAAIPMAKKRDLALIEMINHLSLYDSEVQLNAEKFLVKAHHIGGLISAAYDSNDIDLLDGITLLACSKLIAVLEPRQEMEYSLFLFNKTLKNCNNHSKNWKHSLITVNFKRAYRQLLSSPLDLSTMHLSFARIANTLASKKMFEEAQSILNSIQNEKDSIYFLNVLLTNLKSA